MKRIHAIFEDEFVDDFRDTVYRRMGPYRGAMKEALEAAILLWMTDKTTRAWYNDNVPTRMEAEGRFSSCTEDFEKFLKQKTPNA